MNEYPIIHETLNLSHGELMRFLAQNEACEPATEWLQETGYDLKTAWQKCERGDWMLWLAEKTHAPKRVLVGAAGECAALVLDKMTHPDSVAAVHACAAYYRGEIGDEQLRGIAAYAAARAARAAYAAYAAARAADAAAYAAYAAARAAYAAYAAEAADAAAEAATLSKCAEIARKFIKII